MGFDDVNGYLQSRGLPASKFENVGDSHTGTLVDADTQVVTDTEGVIQYNKDGVTPKKQLVLTWQTDERDPSVEGDKGLRKLYCSWRLENSIRAAFRDVGAEGLEPNATLTVTYKGDEKVQVPGSNMKVNAKTYEASYKRPAFAAQPSAAADEFPATYSDDSIKLAQSMWDSGVQDEALISQATGIPADYLRKNVLTV